MIRYFFERVRRMERQEFDEIILKNAESFFDYFRLACIAVRNEKVAETSAFLEKTFEKLGAKKVERCREEGANPVVFAEFSGKAKKRFCFTIIMTFSRLNPSKSGILIRSNRRLKTKDSSFAELATTKANSSCVWPCSNISTNTADCR